VVILDAFLGDSSPSHLMTKEAFEGVRRVMEEDGVLVINSFGSFEPGRDFFTSSLYKTLSSVFRSVKIHHEGGGNVFFVASGTESLEMKRRPSLEGVHPTVVERARRAYDRTTVVNPESGMVLTDDYNPVEFRDAENREEVRRNLMRFFR